MRLPRAHSHPALTCKHTRAAGAGEGSKPRSGRRGRRPASLLLSGGGESLPAAAGRAGHWAAKGAKSQSAPLLQLPRTRGEGNPLQRMGTETHSPHHPAWALALSAGPLRGEPFPGFGTVISFPAPSAKTCSSLASSQMGAGTPAGWCHPANQDSGRGGGRRAESKSGTEADTFPRPWRQPRADASLARPPRPRAPAGQAYSQGVRQ